MSNDETDKISEKILAEVKEIIQRKNSSHENDFEEIKKVFEKYTKK